MAYTNSQYASVLTDVLKTETSAGRPAILKNFILILQKHNRLSQLSTIMDEMEQQARRAAGQSHVKICCSNESAGAVAEKKLAGSTYHIAAKTTQPEIGGGIRLKIDDTLIDNSLTGRFRRLRQAWHI